MLFMPMPDFVLLRSLRIFFGGRPPGDPGSMTTLFWPWLSPCGPRWRATLQLGRRVPGRWAVAVRRRRRLQRLAVPYIPASPLTTRNRGGVG